MIHQDMKVGEVVGERESMGGGQEKSWGEYDLNTLCTHVKNPIMKAIIMYNLYILKKNFLKESLMYN